MEQIKRNNISKIYHTTWGQWLIPSIMTALLFFIIFAFIPITFRSDDDYVLMGCLNGTLTGVPSFFCSYTNPIFSYLISILYSFTLSINWYMLYHYFFLFCSIITIGRCIFYISNRKKLSLWKPLVIFAWLLMGVFFYPLYTISFTLTAAITATASVAIIFTIDPIHDSRKQQILSYILCTIFIFMGFILRDFPAEAVLCFLVLGFFYQIIKLRINIGSFNNPAIYRLMISFTVIILLLGSAFALKKAEKWRYEDFDNFNYARSLYMDYPRISYGEMKEEYDKEGITEELVYILDQWCFADDKINAKSLRRLAEFGGHALERSLKKTLKIGFNLIRTDKFVLSGLLICFFWGIIGIFLAIPKKVRISYWMELLTALCAILGAFFQCFILCWIGRFLSHVFFSISIPCTISVVILLIKSMEQEGVWTFLENCLCNKTNNLMAKMLFSKQKKVMVVLLFCTILITCYKPINYALNPDVQKQRISTVENARSFYRYIIENPENFYMYDVASKYDIDPFPESIDQPRNNAISWGDSFYHSPIYNAQVASTGRETFYLDALLENNIFFISDPRKYSINGVLIYMCQEYNVAAMQIVDKINENLNVYKFKQLPFDMHYTGWIEAYDRRYYIKNGKIQTGWFNVDGNIYYGIPSRTTYKKRYSMKDSKYETIRSYDIYEKNINDEDYIICTGNSVATGWITIGKDSYCFDSNGIMQTGWAFYEPLGWCYLQDDGKLMCSDWLITDEGKFHFNYNGKLDSFILNGKHSDSLFIQSVLFPKEFNNK